MMAALFTVLTDALVTKSKFHPHAVYSALRPEKEADSFTANSLIVDFSNHEWSNWSECSDSCGGCGVHNRTLKFQYVLYVTYFVSNAILRNGTHIVHVRRCNFTPCKNDKPCCEPFKLENQKCLASRYIPVTESDHSQDSINDAILAWGNIKSGEEHLATGDSEGDTFLSTSSAFTTDLKITGKTDDFPEGSGEFDGEIDHKVDNTEPSTIGKDADILYVSKKKNENWRGYGRKGYKRRKRRQRNRHPSVGLKRKEAGKNKKSQKVFDEYYEYDYYDYYYYY
uniref:Uncharacterized protein n=1 Tax=Setaria digitata TaxID=48799 RepID=A0A915Q278_9BILA